MGFVLVELRKKGSESLARICFVRAHPSMRWIASLSRRHMHDYRATLRGRGSGWCYCQLTDANRKRANLKFFKIHLLTAGSFHYSVIFV